MALIKLDTKSLTMSVEVGILEEYKPDDGLRNLSDRANQLRENTMQFIFELTKTQTMPEAIGILQQDKDLADQWNLHMGNEYIPALKALVEGVKLKNEQICPGYLEHLNSLDTQI